VKLTGKQEREQPERSVGEAAKTENFSGKQKMTWSHHSICPRVGSMTRAQDLGAGQPKSLAHLVNKQNSSQAVLLLTDTVVRTKDCWRRHDPVGRAEPKIKRETEETREKRSGEANFSMENWAAIKLIKGKYLHWKEGQVTSCCSSTRYQNKKQSWAHGNKNPNGKIRSTQVAMIGGRSDGRLRKSQIRLRSTMSKSSNTKAQKGNNEQHTQKCKIWFFYWNQTRIQPIDGCHHPSSLI
jgi:hypothetical protein